MDSALVVGGRTTGLVMAAELARRGVPVRIIDQSPGIDPHVRANLLHSRTLEVCQGLGLTEALLEGSVAEKGIVFYRDGEKHGENPHAPIDSPFPFGMSQSQAHVEAILVGYLNRCGVDVERQVALVSMDQDDEGVTVGLERADGDREISRCSWLIACDGAHSTVRRLGGIPFPGDRDVIPYILGDVVLRGGEELDPSRGHVFFHDSGELFLFTRLPGNRQFIVATLEPGAQLTGEPSLAELQAIVSDRARRDFQLSDPLWLAYFGINYRLVPHYRQGRVFLAGDAAHVHSLLAGQGMNVGIQDAFNLGWKMALVAKGLADDRLLDSYELERRTVADGVVSMTRQITDTMEEYTDLSADERKAFVSHLYTPESERLEAALHLQEVDLDYSASPLSVDGKGEFEGGPAVGTQAPDATELLFEGQAISLYALPADEQYRLLLFCTEDGKLEDILSAADAAGQFSNWLTPYLVFVGRSVSYSESELPFKVILDQVGHLHSRYGVSAPCLFLVRPDGYIAFKSQNINAVSEYFAQTQLIRP
ncbi:MAG: FAD-dependent monooxygenase [Pseudomonadota bacterium]